jgi:hypothetical protein
MRTQSGELWMRFWTTALPFSKSKKLEIKMQTQDEIIARRVLNRIIGDPNKWEKGLTIWQLRDMIAARWAWYETANK